MVDSISIVVSQGKNLDLMGGLRKDMYNFLLHQIQSRHGFEDCLASLDLSGESSDTTLDSLMPNPLVVPGCEATRKPGGRTRKSDILAFGFITVQPIRVVSASFNDFLELSLINGTFTRSTQEHEGKLRQSISSESVRRENILLMRITSKEQEIQDLMVQIQELKSSQAASAVSLRSSLLDPAVNLLVQHLRKELETAKSTLEETQNELSAWKFTPDSNTGKRLMAKCRLLYQENEELGRMISSGRLAKLEGDLALQRNFSEEMKKSQSELDEFLLELDEDVEGMQSTIYFLQQQLRQTREQLSAVQKENEMLRNVNGIATEARHISSELERSHSGESSREVGNQFIQLNGVVDHPTNQPSYSSPSTAENNSGLIQRVARTSPSNISEYPGDVDTHRELEPGSNHVIAGNRAANEVNIEADGLERTKQSEDGEPDNTGNNEGVEDCRAATAVYLTDGSNPRFLEPLKALRTKNGEERSPDDVPGGSGSGDVVLVDHPCADNSVEASTAVSSVANEAGLISEDDRNDEIGAKCRKRTASEAKVDCPSHHPALCRPNSQTVPEMENTPTYDALGDSQNNKRLRAELEDEVVANRKEDDQNVS
uniref:EOG090X0FYD n=1 Tax=Alona affinis TaxID=381656 RepID=A0A9N6WR67_9CRUS|nr:EOG090X0FYD [Alona affinis]